MNSIIKQFFTALEKYEDQGTDDIHWAEWAAQDIDKKIVQKFTKNDWKLIQQYYKDKSANIKSLIVGQINLNDDDYIAIKLELLVQIIKTEPIAIAFEALKKITFGFVTSGRDKITNVLFYKEELKGVFMTSKKEYLIELFFTQDFLNKAQEIATDCDESHKNEILAFLRIIDKI